MSIYINIAHDWREIPIYEEMNCIDGTTHHIQTKVTQSIIYNIYATYIEEFNELIIWIEENIPENDVILDTEKLIIELTIYTKESAMAFKLRWT